MVYDCEVAILPCTRWVSDLRPPSGEDFLRSSGSNHSCSSVDTFSSQSPFVCAAMGWAPVQPSFGTFWYFCLQINKNPFLYLPWSIDPRKFTFQKIYILEKLHSRKFTYYLHVKSSWLSCWWRWGCSLAFPSSEVLLPCPALPGSCLPLQCSCLIPGGCHPHIWTHLCSRWCGMLLEQWPGNIICGSLPINLGATETGRVLLFIPLRAGYAA